jgi:hypothetical protein
MSSPQSPAEAGKKRKNRRPGKGERERRKLQDEAGPKEEVPPPLPPPVPKSSIAPAPTAAPAPTPAAAAAAAPYKFEVDYNDHFETPFAAYRDLQPFLSLVMKAATGVIFDPYYCQGRVREYLARLGFRNVFNENADFYATVRARRVPPHDVLVTNPPYSGDHKQRLLEYLLQQQPSRKLRPFALLLPAYTATKSYWRSFVDATETAHGDASVFLYLMPPASYEYDHPEGTGKDTPPFYSCWFLGGFSQDVSLRIESAFAASTELVVLRSVEAMVQRGFVTDKRPNPKQRRKKARVGQLA